MSKLNAFSGGVEDFVYYSDFNAVWAMKTEKWILQFLTKL